ncbi:STAS domain-containing protein [Oryzomicrobium sp.]|uniref:STAS domain-containing protein n=1 Tax=Oryzomicrobium sp. TaxID=1911578 RepID=UPI002FE40936
MEIHCHNEGGTTRLRFQGEFNIYAAGVKAQLLSLCAGPEVQLDLAEVDEIDTVGIQLLLLLYRQARAENRRLTLAECSPAVSGLIELYGLRKAFGLTQPGEGHERG